MQINLPKIYTNESLNISKIEEDVQQFNGKITKQNASQKLQKLLNIEKQKQFENICQYNCKQQQEMNNYQRNLDEIYKSQKRIKKININQKKNNQIIKKNLKNNLQQLKQIQTQQQSILWKPMTRESTSMCVYNNMIYMYAGIGDKYFQDLNVYDPSKKLWTQISKNCQFIEGRYGNSIYGYNEKLFIFGGKISSATNIVSTDILNYDIKNDVWKQIKSNSIDLIGSSCVIGRNLVILGGNNDKVQILSDMWYFNMQSYIWTKLKFTMPIVNNTMTSVFDQIRNLDYIFLDKKYKEEINSQIKYEGIYLFQEKLQVIQVDQYLFKVFQPITEGQAPQQRIQHTATFKNDYNFYCICGGKSNNIILNDFHVLNLENMNWMIINITGDDLLQCRQHNIAYVQGEFYIFGGFNFEEYINFDPIVILQDLTQNKQQQKQQNNLFEKNNIKSQNYQ